MNDGVTLNNLLAKAFERQQVVGTHVVSLPRKLVLLKLADTHTHTKGKRLAERKRVHSLRVPPSVLPRTNKSNDDDGRTRIGGTAKKCDQELSSGNRSRLQLVCFVIFFKYDHVHLVWYCIIVVGIEGILKSTV